MGGGRNLVQVTTLLLWLMPFAIVVPLGIDLGFLTVALPDIVLGLWVVCLLLLWQDRQNRKLYHPPAFRWFVLFIGVVWLSYFLGETRDGESTLRAIRWSEGLVFYWVLWQLIRLTEQSAESLVSALKWAGLVAGVYAILQFNGIVGGAFADNDQFATIMRPGGYAHGGAFGAIIMTAIVAFYADLFRFRSWGLRVVCAVGIAVAGVGLFLTLTRTWLMATGLAIGFYTLIAGDRRVRVALLGLIGLGAVGLLAITQTGIMTALYGDEADYLVERLLSSGNVISDVRMIKWQTALYEFRQNPVMGVGPENLYLETLVVDAEENRFRSDNMWLDVLVEHGVVGFIAFLGWVGMVVLESMRGVRLNEVDSVYIAVFCGWLIGAFFWNITIGYMLLFFLLLIGFGLGARNL